MIDTNDLAPRPGTPSAEAFAQDLQRAAERVTSVLEREVPLLKALRGPEVYALLDEKRAATDGYTALAQKLRASPDLLKDLPSSARDVLKATAHRLASATEANARALRAGSEANGRLVKTIAQAVGEQHLGAGRYRPDGRPRTAGTGDPAPACSVNQVL